MRIDVVKRLLQEFTCVFDDGWKAPYFVHIATQQQYVVATGMSQRRSSSCSHVCCQTCRQWTKPRLLRDARFLRMTVKPLTEDEYCLMCTHCNALIATLLCEFCAQPLCSSCMQYHTHADSSGSGELDLSPESCARASCCLPLCSECAYQVRVASLCYTCGNVPAVEVELLSNRSYCAISVRGGASWATLAGCDKTMSVLRRQLLRHMLHTPSQVVRRDPWIRATGRTLSVVPGTHRAV